MVVPVGKNIPPVVESAYVNCPVVAGITTVTLDAVSTGLTSTVPSAGAFSRKPILDNRPNRTSRNGDSSACVNRDRPCRHGI